MLDIPVIVESLKKIPYKDIDSHINDKKLSLHQVIQVKNAIFNSRVKIETTNGTRYTVNKKYHREDGPAVNRPNGVQKWFCDGNLIEPYEFDFIHKYGKYTYYDNDTLQTGVFTNLPFGATIHLQDGKLHNEHGPAILYENGHTEFWVNGDKHHDHGPAVILIDGTHKWYLNGKRHRPDGPAVDRPNGVQEWYIHGKRHRIGGPALIYPDAKVWFVNGQRHREDGPAIIKIRMDREEQLEDGSTIIKPRSCIEWYLNGKRHRPDGPAVICSCGDKMVSKWYFDGKLHNLNNPAVVYENGTVKYFVDGKRHNPNGPAIIYTSGNTVYYLNGEKVKPF